MYVGNSMNYSKLFAQLINKNGQMDDTIASFLYYMFPKEMFVRALSLIESSDMFIYVFENQEMGSKSMSACKSSSTNPDISFDGSNTKYASPSPEQKPDISSGSTQNLLASSIYENESELLYRLIVKADGDTNPSICVDLTNWFCSCDEYADCFLEQVKCCSAKEDDYMKSLIRDVHDLQDFSNDRFAQLDAHSLSRQRYFFHDKVICPHLLAFSMLLRSSQEVLQYFTVNKSQVLLIPISNMDEWLKLHINIVA